MKSRRGLVVVSVALVAVLSMLFIPGCIPTADEETINEVKDQALDAARQANLKMIDSVIQVYYAETGQWPTGLDQLSQYFTKGVPQDPAGGQYYIVMQNGEAKAAVR